MLISKPMKPEVRSLFLFCGSGTTALLAGLLFPMGESTERIIISVGYLSMVLCCGVFLLSLKGLIKESAFPRLEACRNNWSSWGAILLATS